MTSNNTIVLPKQENVAGTRSPLVPEGDWAVEVRNAAKEANNYVRVVFVILTAGPSRGRRLHEVFRLDGEVGSRMFRQFLSAIAVAPENECVDLDQCRGKKLFVTLKHKEKNGRVWANIVAHVSMKEQQ